MNSTATLALIIPIVAIVGGIIAAVVATVMRGRVRELEIRERIALIERGLVPAPESDPQGFERAMGRYEQARGRGGRTGRRRYRSGGVTLMGVGFGLMLLISVAGDSPSAGIGVGGFLVILGVAFLINSRLDGGHAGTAPAAGANSPSAPSDTFPRS
ncbi:MAG: hypothetical protein IT176_11530 [Acidobacteria bacterium]|nr:hypothetical protein [Acidobacteriota bacterium]